MCYNSRNGKTERPLAAAFRPEVSGKEVPPVSDPRKLSRKDSHLIALTGILLFSCLITWFFFRTLRAIQYGFLPAVVFAAFAVGACQAVIVLNTRRTILRLIPPLFLAAVIVSAVAYCLIFSGMSVLIVFALLLFAGLPVILTDAFAFLLALILLRIEGKKRGLSSGTSPVGGERKAFSDK